MNKDRALTKDSFDSLLAWLDPDRDKAGIKYEEIRKTLIKIFVRRDCSPAEEMADETINRVIARIDEIASTYKGDPALYFYGVAQNIFRERLKKKPIPYPPPDWQPVKNIDQDYECLEECIEQLPPKKRQMILEYFQEDKEAKIQHRKMLAKHLGITPHTLRVRVYRIQVELKDCIAKCRKRKQLE